MNRWWYQTTTALLRLFLLVSQCQAWSKSAPNIVIVGGGPCGLFLAATLLKQNQELGKNYNIHVLEKQARQGQPVNAFGMGLSPRMVKTLEALDPELSDRVLSVGQLTDIGGQHQKQYPGFEFRIAQRQDICQQMVGYIEDTFASEVKEGRFQISYDEGCESVDFEEKTVTTSQGRNIHYDLLVAADGINSKIRQQLVANDDSNDWTVEQYYNKFRAWKALELPPQSFLVPGTFQRFMHPSFFCQILPRYPEGHIGLMFYAAPEMDNGDDKRNPVGINTAEELKQAMTQTLLETTVDEGKSETKRRLDPLKGFRKIMGMKGEKDRSGLLVEKDEERQVVFNDEALEHFVQSRPGRSQVMKINRYHDSKASVALIGDAAHGMYSLLGQGCACGLQNTKILGETLQQQSSDLASALEAYSEQAVPEGHAITDLNLVSHAFASKKKLKFLPSMIWNNLRGKGLMQNVGRHDIPYTKLLKQNRAIVKVAKEEWGNARIPVPVSPKVPPATNSKVLS
ncbi:Kynurenine 3-monooxygenase [Seminavis robusta]|uniref:Kynurenine 3-monooxygenase n=1 Tax=Seminavis robusta TaxID=568900 RepID=A0A9N8ELV4_9STRA|nr:Kynurenine 3-monooxygenase [Seminavis robusta]|eukprot:Sro1333_g263610.1 Kynurenine 3-monooxygenase (512) ;mRNA; f:3411-4946